MVSFCFALQEILFLSLLPFIKHIQIFVLEKKTEETLGIRKVFVSHNLQWEFRWFRKYGKSVNFFDSVIGGLEM